MRGGLEKRGLVGHEARRLGVNVRREVPLGAGRVDLLLSFGDGSPDVAVDVTVRAGSGSLSDEESLAQRAKAREYGAACSSGNLVLQTWFVSPVGSLGPDTVRFVESLFGRASFGSGGAVKFFFRHLSAVLQRQIGLAYLSLISPLFLLPNSRAR